MARKPYQPTKESREFVRNAVLGGITQASICKALDIRPETLTKHFKNELERAIPLANAKLVGKAYKEAMAGNTAVLIFLLKVRLGMRESGSIDITRELPSLKVTVTAAPTSE